MLFIFPCLSGFACRESLLVDPIAELAFGAFFLAGFGAVEGCGVLVLGALVVFVVFTLFLGVGAGVEALYSGLLTSTFFDASIFPLYSAVT